MSHSHDSSASSRVLLVAILLFLGAYCLALYRHLPQRGTQMLVASQQAHHAADHEAPGPAAEIGHDARGHHPAYWTVLPFAALLLAIAVFPLIPRVSPWWDNNLNRFYIAGGLGILAVAYYLVWYEHPVIQHWPAERVVANDPLGLNWDSTLAVLTNAVGFEFFPFITLLLTLYTITGGIRITGDLPAHPATNAAFLGIGAILASFIGTTGAAMLLIRPLLETNQERRYVRHTVVFFIFIVCNCGGCLLPLGDPPLFLGYLVGVPFLWTLTLWKEWLFVNALLIAVYYVWDHFWCYPHERPRDISRDETRVRGLRFSGLWPNALLLVGVIASIGLLDPSKAVPFTQWHPWVYLREAVQLGLVAISLCFNAKVRKANQFSYHAITEVAVLFLGLFLCMQAPIHILRERGPTIGLDTAAGFFWATGGLSAVLDNAPTYVVFFATAKSLGGVPAVAGVREALLVGISLGAVFMGAMTYIGNGPNFMVKTIAEKSGVAMPSFFGYLIYSFAVLLPILVLTEILFIG